MDMLSGKILKRFQKYWVLNITCFVNIATANNNMQIRIIWLALWKVGNHFGKLKKKVELPNINCAQIQYLWQIKTILLVHEISNSYYLTIYFSFLLISIRDKIDGVLDNTSDMSNLILKLLIQYILITSFSLLQ